VIVSTALPLHASCLKLLNVIFSTTLSFQLTFSSFRQEAWNDKVVETMTFNSFRQEAWNVRVVETMTFISFRQEAWNDRVVDFRLFV
jgi:hypothetical protein